MHNLNFHYPSRPQTLALSGLSGVIQPGQPVAVVGPSGAGKTTLFGLLLRFHDPQAGQIVLDGVNINEMTLHDLRARIGIVPQEPVIFSGTAMENIRYGRPNATEAEVEQAASRAEAQDFIARLSDWRGRAGYDAHVGERGVKLSGGQRQRIAIARVLLKDAPILVLDEATSALDSEAEAAIQASLDGLMAGKTVIAVAHRLSTLARMDRLVVLDRGRVAEQGTHAELLALGGVYARLWRRQSGGFIGD
jgi:ABC-type multidrug transport system fused ATPase/permease subunit